MPFQIQFSFFSYSCAAVDKISTDSASRGPSVIAELLVRQMFARHGHTCHVHVVDSRFSIVRNDDLTCCSSALCQQT